MMIDPQILADHEMSRGERQAAKRTAVRTQKSSQTKIIELFV